jgi:hypothetical protein
MMYQLRIISTGTEIDDFFEQSGLFVSYIVFVYLLQGLLVCTRRLKPVTSASGRRVRLQQTLACPASLSSRC